MMWMCGVGRIVGSIALVLAVLVGPLNAFSYGSATTHLEVTEAMLGGYGGDEFEEFFEVTSGAIDLMADDFEAHFPEMRKKFNPWTHRLMGHSWSLDEEVPEWVLERLEKEYGVSRPKVIHYCKEYREKIIKKTIEMTGLARDTATAFAALVIDLHQLQDLEPGNRAVKYVGRIEKVMANINRHIAALLVDRPELAAVLQKKLNAVLNEGLKKGLSEKEMAKKMIDALIACHLGTVIHSCHKKAMKLTYNIDRVVDANAKAAAAREKQTCAEANLRVDFDKMFNDVITNQPRLTAEVLRTLVDGPLSATEIATALQMEKGGRVSSVLLQLAEADYVCGDAARNPEMGAAIRERRYRLCDNYSRYYLKFVERVTKVIDGGSYVFTSIETDGYFDAVVPFAKLLGL